MLRMLAGCRRYFIGGLLLSLAAANHPVLAADEAGAPVEEAALPEGPGQPTAEPADGDGSGAVSFLREMAPVLLGACAACHGAAEPKSDYQVVTFSRLIRPGASGEAAITPGSPDQSELLRLIASDDPDERMPKEADPLPAEFIVRLRRWIEEGARFDGADPEANLAELIPRPAHPDPPEQYRVPLPITAVAFHPNGGELAVGGYREVTIWRPSDGALVRRIKNVAERTYGLDYNGDGSLLAVAAGIPGQAGEVKLFRPSDGVLLADLGRMSDVAFDVAFSPDGTRLAAAAADRSIRIFDVATRQQTNLIEDHADWVMAIAWNHDGTRLASASRDKTSKVFDSQTGDAQTTFPDHGQVLFGVAFSADGSQVLTAGADNKVRIWNPADGKQIAELGGFGHEVHRLISSGDRLFSCSADKTVREHALADRKEVRKLEGHADWIYALDVNESAQRIASGSFDGEVRIWNLEDGNLVAAFKAAPGRAAAAGDAQAAADAP